MDQFENPPRNDLMGDILRSYEKTGGMDNLKGQGKPLSQEYLTGDVFQHFQKIAKDAGFKPHWLKLQHEIREEIQDISYRKKSGLTEGLQFRVTKVNEKIIAYNKACPPPLQKGQVRWETIENIVQNW